MEEKIIGAILSGERVIQVKGINVYLSSYKIKPFSTHKQKEVQAAKHAKDIVKLINS